MKKFLFFAVAVAAMASCSSNYDLSEGQGQSGGKETIGFQVLNRNSITRATSLNESGHYNFGVFAYKSSDGVNSVMDNYLVGYMDENKKKGYYMDGNQTTMGDSLGNYNGHSMWQYEMLGYAEYNYLGTEGYYTKDQDKFMSNKANQYLKYWDLHADYTTFYAYSPYINGDGTATYDNSSHVLTIPNGSIKAAYVEGNGPTELCEYMYAATKVDRGDYGKDVALDFKRLNAKVNIKFWEDIKGYTVRILNLTNDYGVSAAPAVESGNNYTKDGANYINTCGYKVNFNNVGNPTVEQYGADPTNAPLKFTSPAATEIGTTRVLATKSPTTYYALPKGNETGFTFHVSYELTANETGERIKVQDATVHVPADNAKWESNHHYTYIFKITKNSNGTTGNPGTIEPNSPTVNTDNALYPIVFDNCTVEDWATKDSDHTISDGTTTTDYSVVLEKKSVKASTSNSFHAYLYLGDTQVGSPQGTWEIEEDQTSILDNNKKVTVDDHGVVTVPVSAKTGVYTVKYTLADTEKNSYPNHSDYYKAQFYVVGNYVITLSTTEIGTGGKAATTLTTNRTLAGETEVGKAGTFSLQYPDGLTGDQIGQVTIDTNGKVTVGTAAKPGTYKVVYTTDEGDATVDFVVKDFGFTLSKTIVNLSQIDQTVSVTSANDVGANSTSTYSITGGSNVDIVPATGKLTVKPTATTGVYTVTRTVNCNGSTTVYERTFAVRDIYTLSLSQYVVDNDDNVTIQVTATKNDKDNKNDVEYPDATGLDCVKADGTIKVLSNCTPGTYTVKNGDQTVTFIVQD